MSEPHVTTSEIRRSRRRTVPRRILVLALSAAALTPAAALARPADDVGAPGTGSQHGATDTATSRLVAQERSYASANRPNATATPAATVRPSSLLAQARYYSSYGPATTTTGVSAVPAPAGDDGTSWSTIVLVGLGACLAGAGAVAVVDRRLGVRHSRVPA
jgi:hypothetical protein